jgi:hypothetical protein
MPIIERLEASLPSLSAILYKKSFSFDGPQLMVYQKDPTDWPQVSFPDSKLDDIINFII